MKGAQDCPMNDCQGTNHGKSFFQLDEELIRRIIKKSCSEVDSQSVLNNGVDKEDSQLALNYGVFTDNVAGSSQGNQSLTSG